MDSLRKYHYWSIAVMAAMLFLSFMAGYIGGAVRQRQVNPIPPISINRQEDINVRNMRKIIDWVSDNFTVLYEISKDDSLFIGE